MTPPKSTSYAPAPLLVRVPVPRLRRLLPTPSVVAESRVPPAAQVRFLRVRVDPGAMVPPLARVTVPVEVMEPVPARVPELLTESEEVWVSEPFRTRVPPLMAVGPV